MAINVRDLPKIHAMGARYSARSDLEKQLNARPRYSSVRHQYDSKASTVVFAAARKRDQNKRTATLTLTDDNGYLVVMDDPDDAYIYRRALRRAETAVAVADAYVRTGGHPRAARTNKSDQS